MNSSYVVNLSMCPCTLSDGLTLASLTRGLSTRITDAGIAIRHSRGYFSILQGPERNSRAWIWWVRVQNQRQSQNSKSKSKRCSCIKNQVTQGFHFSVVRNIHGFPPEAACRSKVGCFDAVLILFHSISSRVHPSGLPKSKNIRVLATTGAIYYVTSLGDAGENELLHFCLGAAACYWRLQVRRNASRTAYSI